MKRPARALALSLGTIVLLLGLAELAFRLAEPAGAHKPLDGFRKYLLTGAMRGYEPRAYTVYQRIRTERPFNELGFSDGPWTRARTPGVPRIVCMGGSTTEGGNPAGRKGSYPYLLERALEERTGRDFEVLNAGMSGWTTAEMIGAWFLTLQDFRPDVLVIHEAVNDCEPRFRADFQADYSHWRVPVRTHPATGLERLLVSTSRLYLWFRLRRGKAPEIRDVCTLTSTPPEPQLARGTLPHETSLSFRRNVRSIARSAAADGARIVLMTLPAGSKPVGAFWRYGIAEHNEHLRALCAENGWLLADAERAFAARPELAAEFRDLVHLEPGGNRAKAELVADALAEWVASLPPQDARPPHAQ